MQQKNKRPAAQMRMKAAVRKTKPKPSTAPKRASAKTSRDKVHAYRQRMRAKGLRLVQMWLPDTSSPAFAKQAHLDSLAIANSPTEKEDQAFIDSVQWWTSEEADAVLRLEPDRWWKEPKD
jgi:Protein  of unknown function (DUF3018)